MEKRPSAAFEKKSQLTPNAQDQETKPHLGIQAYLSILFYLFFSQHEAYIKFFQHTRHGLRGVLIGGGQNHNLVRSFPRLESSACKLTSVRKKKKKVEINKLKTQKATCDEHLLGLGNIRVPICSDFSISI